MVNERTKTSKEHASDAQRKGEKRKEVQEVKCTALPKYTLEDVNAMRALSEGRASDVQQKHAFKFIVKEATKMYDLVYQPDSFDQTAFRAGRAFVGQILVGMLQPETLDYLRKNERK